MFKNLHEFITKFPTDTECRKYLEQQRWENGKPICPYCGCDRIYVLNGGKMYKCASNECYKRFTVTVGTFLESSKIPLNKWLMAIYICTAHRKGISSHQLAKDVGVTQKSAWFMLHRIRGIMTDKEPEMLQGAVELDETYMGRKYKSEYVGLSPEEVEYKFTNNSSKGAVLGMAERSGKIRLVKIDGREAAPIRQLIKDNILKGSRLLTDEANIYKAGLTEYNHSAVKHSKREWVRNDVHTNNIEAFWSVMKRGIHGIYHHISYKHLQQYCDEFQFRHNHRHLKDHEKFEMVFSGIIGRLPYKVLVSRKNK